MPWFRVTLAAGARRRVERIEARTQSDAREAYSRARLPGIRVVAVEPDTDAGSSPATMDPTSPPSPSPATQAMQAPDDNSATTILNYEAKRLSPIIAVADIQASIRFYVKVLGFVVARQVNDYVILTRGGASLHLTRAADEGVLAATRRHASIYLEVEGIEALWSHVSQFRDRYRIRDLFDRDYGMREFHICDPDGCLIFVGERIQQP